MNTPPSQQDTLPSSEQIPDILEAAVGQIRFARQYVLTLLDATPQDRWFEIPPGHSSHVAWQVGHLAVAQYGLLMFRLRGRQPDDLELIPGRFRKAYGRGGTPPESPEGQPTPDELLTRMQAVYEQSLETVLQVDPLSLLESVEMPYAVYPCKLGAILFCPLHETLHAGQIGMLRRGLGLESVR